MDVPQGSDNVGQQCGVVSKVLPENSKMENILTNTYGKDIVSRTHVAAQTLGLKDDNSNYKELVGKTASPPSAEFGNIFSRDNFEKVHNAIRKQGEDNVHAKRNESMLGFKGVLAYHDDRHANRFVNDFDVASKNMKLDGAPYKFQPQTESVIKAVIGAHDLLQSDKKLGNGGQTGGAVEAATACALAATLGLEKDKGAVQLIFGLLAGTTSLNAGETFKDGKNGTPTSDAEVVAKTHAHAQHTMGLDAQIGMALIQDFDYSRTAHLPSKFNSPEVIEGVKATKGYAFYNDACQDSSILEKHPALKDEKMREEAAVALEMKRHQSNEMADEKGFGTKVGLSAGELRKAMDSELLFCPETGSNECKHVDRLEYSQDINFTQGLNLKALNQDILNLMVAENAPKKVPDDFLVDLNENHRFSSVPY
ncbi:hypothetical protein [Vibrio coralliilyticus]|uniref:hypothetical protein n=1 Tax=Vibrio coralliilyticus TaxID=190893 RepID=UPI0017E665A7|nr:hypothetical protein [Vibrio coralliilyticus]NUW68055.1 hypothetical protein [Vibrio coralliilyticus]